MPFLKDCERLKNAINAKNSINLNVIAIRMLLYIDKM